MPRHAGGLYLCPFDFFLAHDGTVGDGARDLTDSGTRACRCEGGPLQQGDGHAFGTILFRVGGFGQLAWWHGCNQFVDFVTVSVQVFEIIDRCLFLYLTIRSTDPLREPTQY